jgi:hypothetical protein
MGKGLGTQGRRIIRSRRSGYLTIITDANEVGAKDAYEEALKLEPGNAQAKSGMKQVDDAIAREAAEDGTTPDLGLGKVVPFISS